MTFDPYTEGLLDEHHANIQLLRGAMSREPETIVGDEGKYILSIPIEEDNGSISNLWGLTVEQANEKFTKEVVDKTVHNFIWEPIRLYRTRLLTESDWTVVEDSPFQHDVKEQWKTYRNALRNVTTDFKRPRDVVWPLKPQ